MADKNQDLRLNEDELFAMIGRLVVENKMLREQLEKERSKSRGTT